MYKPREKKKPRMTEILEAEGWKKSLEGWKDPHKGDKVSLASAWQRRLRALAEKPKVDSESN